MRGESRRISIGSGGARWIGQWLPLSYTPGSALPDDVLADGRILFESEFPLGEGKTAEMFLVYSDGSGVESYRCDHGAARWGGHNSRQATWCTRMAPSLARFTSPSAQEMHVAAPQAEYSGEISELGFGRVAGECAAECESELRGRDLEAGDDGIA